MMFKHASVICLRCTMINRGVKVKNMYVLSIFGIVWGRLFEVLCHLFESLQTRLSPLKGLADDRILKKIY